MDYDGYLRKVDEEWTNNNNLDKPTDDDIKDLCKDEDKYYRGGSSRFTSDLIGRRGFGDTPKLNEEETHLLERCASVDMLSMLKEEFTKNPIVLDENGGLVK